MKRNTFKKGYMILHTAVAVSIVLIGIKVLIGFGNSAFEGAKILKSEVQYQKGKFDKDWRDYKKKKRIINAKKDQAKTSIRLATMSCMTTYIVGAVLTEAEKECVDKRLKNMNNIEAVWYKDAQDTIRKLDPKRKVNWDF